MLVIGKHACSFCSAYIRLYTVMYTVKEVNYDTCELFERGRNDRQYLACQR